MTISYNEDQQEELIDVAKVFLIFSIISLIFASFSIFIYYKYHDQFQSKTTARVVILISIADILRCAFGIYLTIRYISDQSDITNVGLCSTLGFIHNFYESLTHFCPFLIPLLTYRSINHSIKTFEKKAYFCCFIIIIVFCSIPFWFLFLEDGGYQPVDGGMICFIKNSYVIICCLHVPIAVTCVGSFFLIYKIYKKTGQTSDLKMLVFPLIIVVTRLAAYIRRPKEDSDGGHYLIWLMYIMRIMLPVSGILNPIGYLYFDDEFRKFLFGTFSINNKQIKTQSKHGVHLINSVDND